MFSTRLRRLSAAVRGAVTGPAPRRRGGPPPARAAEVRARPRGAGGERLEDRLLLTAVRAIEFDGTLFVLGTEAADGVFVSDDGFGDYTVESFRPGGTVNGFAGFDTITGVTEYIVALTYGGDDFVSVGDPADPKISVNVGVYVGTGAGADTVYTDNIDAAGYVAVIGGAGDDEIISRQVNTGDYYAYGEAGNDVVENAGVTVQLNYVVVLDAGNDTLRTDGNDIFGTSFVYTGEGDDNIILRNDLLADVNEGINLYTEAGVDVVQLDNVRNFGYSVLNTGAGGDSVFVSGSDFEDNAFLDLGTGNDLAAFADNVFTFSSTSGGDGFDLLSDNGNNAGDVRFDGFDDVV